MQLVNGPKHTQYHLKRVNYIKGKIRTFIFTHGAPKVIVTDCEKEFVNEDVKELVNQIAMKHSTTAAYNLRCNGPAESCNKTIMQMLRKTTEADQDTLTRAGTLTYHI
jgi:hypothetical protein